MPLVPVDLMVGRRIAALRERAGLTVKALADGASLGEARLIEIETAKIRASPEELAAVARVLQVRVKAFFEVDELNGAQDADGMRTRFH